MFSISGSEYVVILLLALLFGWLGYRIGAPKGRPVQGAAFGVLLNLLGLVIVALLPSRTTKSN